MKKQKERKQKERKQKERKQKERKQKGITLIALIITIIVMLILVGVTVSIALNGGLFKTAKQAVDKTKTASEEESGLKYEYEIAKATEGYTGTYEDYVLLKKYGLRIGDKVNYDEGTSGSYTTDASKGTGISYTSNTLNQGTYTVDGANGTVAAGDLEWVVLGVNDEGQVEIISTTPTTAKLTLYGKEGYLNAVTENGTLGTLDTFCNNLYGQGEGAIGARSVAMEDVYKLAGIEMEINSTEYTYKCILEEESQKVKFYNIKTADITDDNKDGSNGWREVLCASSQRYLPDMDWTLDSNDLGPKTFTSYFIINFNQKYFNYTGNRGHVLNYIMPIPPDGADPDGVFVSDHFLANQFRSCEPFSEKEISGSEDVFCPEYGVYSSKNRKMGFYTDPLFKHSGDSDKTSALQPIVTLSPDASILKQTN